MASSGKWAALVTLGVIYFSPVRAETLAEIQKVIRKRFPDVPQLSTRELAEWLGDTNRIQPVLVDARTSEEYAVSHLKKAVHAEDVSSVQNAKIPRERPIVAYCSVGYRSSQLGEKLKKAGYQQVFNLEGSIFSWANEGRPVFRGEKAVSKVHPYNRKWGKLLREEFHP